MPTAKSGDSSYAAPAESGAGSAWPGALSMEEGGGESSEKRIVWNEKLCIQCDNWLRCRSYFASPKVRRMSRGKCGEIEDNMPFIQGITVSGGECTLYPEFLTELYRKAGRGLTCFSDSNGCVDLSEYPELMAVTDQVMLDVKAWDYEVFKRLTGGDGSVVKKKFNIPGGTEKAVEVRLVCLDGETDMEAVIAGVADAAAPYLKEFRLKLITFRKYGVRGRLEKRNSPSPERMEELRNLAVRCGFQEIQVV